MEKINSVEEALEIAKSVGNVHTARTVQVSYVCKGCGKETVSTLRSFMSGKKTDLLCQTCATKKSFMDKYGVDNVLKDKATREAISAKRTGVPARQTEKTIAAKEEVKQATLKRIHDDIETKYNITRLGEYEGSGCSHIYNWKCNTCGEIFKYPVRYDYPIQCPKCFPATHFQKAAATKVVNERDVVKEKIEDRYHITLLDEYKGKAFINKEGKKEGYQYNWRCNICHSTFQSAVRFDRNLSCPICNPFQHGSSKGQKELTEDLSVYGLKLIPMDRTALEGKEIDIYFPELKFGIEYDGAYWHDEKEDKEKDALAASKNIRIYRIDDKDFCKNKKQVETILIDYMKDNFHLEMKPIKEVEHIKTITRGRKVKCIESSIIYENTVDASEKTNISRSKIYDSCRKGYSADGFHFVWAE